MNLPKKHHAELAKVCDLLRQALTADSRETSIEILSEALRRGERLAANISGVAAKLGKKGGQKTAERGPEYFRGIAAMRKTKSGGRPKKC
jgi:hypothetical protein